MLRFMLLLGISCWLGIVQAQPYSATGTPIVDYNFSHSLDAKAIPLNVFPNPMRDVLTIWVRDLHPDTLHQVQVLGISGELVLHTTLSSSETNLDLSSLPEGWYVLHFRKGQEQHTRRIFKTTGP